MKLLIQGRHLEVSEALREYATSKADRLERFFHPIIKVDVNFEANPDGAYTAKVIVGLPRNHTLVCTEPGKTLTAALDLCVEAIERKLGAFKEKVRGKGSRERVARRLMKGEGS